MRFVRGDGGTKTPNFPPPALADAPMTAVVTDLKAPADQIARSIIAALRGDPPPVRRGTDAVYVMRPESA